MVQLFKLLLCNGAYLNWALMLNLSGILTNTMRRSLKNIHAYII